MQQIRDDGRSVWADERIRRRDCQQIPLYTLISPPAVSICLSRCKSCLALAPTFPLSTPHPHLDSPRMCCYQDTPPTCAHTYPPATPIFPHPFHTLTAQTCVSTWPCLAHGVAPDRPPSWGAHARGTAPLQGEKCVSRRVGKVWKRHVAPIPGVQLSAGPRV